MNLHALLKLVAGLLLGLILGASLTPVTKDGRIPSATRSNHEATDDESSTVSGSGAPTASGPMKIEDMVGIIAEPNSYLEVKHLAAYLNGLQAEDFPKALEQFRSISESDQGWLLDMLIARWMEVDPDGAVKAATQARTIEDKEMAARVIADIYGGWAGMDMDGALGYAQQALSGDERKAALNAILEKMAKDDPARALATARKVDGSQLNEYTKSIFSQWADKDLFGATQALLQLSSEPQFAMAAQGMISRLLEKDPQAAASWVAQLPKGPIRRSALANMADEWGKTDPKATVKWAQGLTGDERAEVLSESYYQWTCQNPEEALTYATTMSGDSSREPLFYWGVGNWAYEDAEAAGRWVAKLPASPEKDGAVGRLMDSWSDYDPEAAAAYLPQLPAGTVRQGATKTVAMALAKQDPEKAAALILQLPSGAARDGAIESASNAMFEIDSAAATELAEKTADEKARLDQVTQLFRRWMTTDPAKATAAAQASSLPEALKSKIVNQAP